MAPYDVIVIGAGLGGLTAGAILAREGRKVLVIERSNSVGGAASSYKAGELFVEGSLHETSDPHHPPRSQARCADARRRARRGDMDAVRRVLSGARRPARSPFLMPDDFDAARRRWRRVFRKPARASISCSARCNRSSPPGVSQSKDAGRSERTPCSSSFRMPATGRCRCRKSSTGVRRPRSHQMRARCEPLLFP